MENAGCDQSSRTQETEHTSQITEDGTEENAETEEQESLAENMEQEQTEYIGTVPEELRQRIFTMPSSRAADMISTPANGIFTMLYRIFWRGDNDRMKQKEENNMKTMKLNDGNQIPVVGFGVFQIPEGQETYEAVRAALEAGYRHIDTAAAYFNEADVGRAVKDSGISREEICVTSKLWLQDYGYEAAKEGLAVSLEKLGMDYVDLYLLHQPYGDVAGAWKALEEAKEEGRIRSIGVSNMTPNIWNQWVPQFQTMPAVNQVECHPFFQQKALRELLAKDDVKIEAYQPLGHGDHMLLNHPVITELAEKYGKNAGQIILRFEIQDGLIVLPKSTHPDRIAGNLNIFDFELTSDEMETLHGLDTGKGHHDPETPGVAEMLLKNYRIHD